MAHSLNCGRIGRKFLQRVRFLKIKSVNSGKAEKPIISVKPGDFEGLPNLWSLHVEKTDLTNFPVRELIEGSPKLGELTLINNTLGEKGKTLFPELGELSNLSLLNIEGNGFEGSLPEELGNLSKLRVLNIEESGIQGPVPESFKNLGELSHIGTDRNAKGKGANEDILKFFKSGDRRQECRLFDGNSRKILKGSANTLLRSKVLREMDGFLFG